MLECTMKIDPNRHPSETPALDGPWRTEEATGCPPVAGAPADVATGHAEAATSALRSAALKAAHELPAVRADLVERMRHKLAAGQVGRDCQGLANAILDDRLAHAQDAVMSAQRRSTTRGEREAAAQTLDRIRNGVLADLNAAFPGRQVSVAADSTTPPIVTIPPGAAAADVLAVLDAAAAAARSGDRNALARALADLRDALSQAGDARMRLSRSLGAIGAPGSVV
jgi:hypothetical protein